MIICVGNTCHGTGMTNQQAYNRYQKNCGGDGRSVNECLFYTLVEKEQPIVTPASAIFKAAIIDWKE